MRTYKEMLKYFKANLTEDTQAIMSEENSFPFHAKIGLVFTTYHGHIPYMKYALKQYRKIKDMFIIGAYDACTTRPEDKTLYRLPYPDVWYLAHIWAFKHYTWGGHRKRHGWLWSHIYASAILRQFKNIEYIFSANGDCVWDKPQGVNEIIELLGDNDFMAGQSETRHTDKFNFIHTCSMVFKREAYFSFIDFIFEKLPEAGTVSYSPESMIQQWARKGDVKWEHAPKQAVYTSGEWKGKCDTYCEEGGPSTWRDVLGFRNLIAEKNWKCTNRKPPLDKKYFDLRDYKTHFSDFDRDTLCQYYLTGDMRYIKLGWDKDPYLPRDVRIRRKGLTIEDYKK